MCLGSGCARLKTGGLAHPKFDRRLFQSRFSRASLGGRSFRLSLSSIKPGRMLAGWRCKHIVLYSHHVLHSCIHDIYHMVIPVSLCYPYPRVGFEEGIRSGFQEQHPLALIPITINSVLLATQNGRYQNPHTSGNHFGWLFYTNVKGILAKCFTKQPLVKF